MHCPRCGQQQVSDETKFCSRCGFQLVIVTELLANGGVLPQLAALQKNKTFFNKKNGVMFGVAWFIFFTMFMTSVWGILNVEELAGLCAVTGVFGALLILIGSLVFLPSSKQLLKIPMQEIPLPAALYGNTGAAAGLPPQRQQPATEYTSPNVGSWRAPDTGDLVGPGSVIEDTTKLLKKDRENQ
jgi:hypothetical protein